LERFSKIFRSNFVQIHLAGAELFHSDRRREGQTDMTILYIYIYIHYIAKHRIGTQRLVFASRRVLDLFVYLLICVLLTS